MPQIDIKERKVNDSIEDKKKEKKGEIQGEQKDKQESEEKGDTGESKEKEDPSLVEDQKEDTKEEKRDTEERGDTDEISDKEVVVMEEKQEDKKEEKEESGDKVEEIKSCIIKKNLISKGSNQDTRIYSGLFSWLDRNSMDLVLDYLRDVEALLCLSTTCSYLYHKVTTMEKLWKHFNKKVNEVMFKPKVITGILNLTYSGKDRRFPEII